MIKPSSAGPFAFCIRFFAPPGSTFELASQQDLCLPEMPGRVVARQCPAPPGALPTDVVFFTVEGEGFETAAEARRVGRQLKEALAILSVRHRLGFDLGQDQSTSSFAASVRDELRARLGVDVRPTIHGLDVYDASIPVVRPELQMRGSVSRPIRHLLTSLVKEVLSREISVRLRFALGLFNGCAYAPKPEGRFLSLVTVVEALVCREHRASAIEDFITSCLESLEKSNLAGEEQRVMRDGLGNLRVQSVLEACSTLVAAAGADAEFFRQCYKARSELLHSGVSKTWPELPQQPHLLEEVVRVVLLHEIDAAKSVGSATKSPPRP